jgi:cytochrome P450
MTRLTNGRWAADRSGNPGGRPGGVAEVRELARTHTAEAIECLLKEMRNGDTSHARIAAANAILDRGYGKATQPMAGDFEKPPIGPSVEERVARARAAIAEAFAEVIRERDEEPAPEPPSLTRRAAAVTPPSVVPPSPPVAQVAQSRRRRTSADGSGWAG